MPDLTPPKPASNDTDQVFADPLAHIAPFQFNQSVVDVFPDMIQRSVPGYRTIITMIGNLAERYAQANSQCYDLGCSLGAATLAMRHRIAAANCGIVAVDNSAAMIQRAENVLAADSGEVPVHLTQADIQQTPIKNASVVVLNFTLQFIPVRDRAAIIKRIFEGLKPGGVFILSEKVAFADAAHHELMIELYHNFKRANGYSDLEIAQKREALENVLIPETLSTHKERLLNAGFASVDVWFQCFNFASMIAHKPC